MGQPEAEAEKEKGNAAYKKKDFETAIGHYDKAIELDPTCITYHTNKAAVYYEKGEYDKCVEVCLKAVEIGRQNRADFKLIGKAYARAAHAFEKKEDYHNALKHYNLSLSESRQPDVEKSARALEKLIKEKERKALELDPNCSEAHEGLMQSYKNDNDPEAARKRAMNDPEIASILSDPAMRLILEQMSDPAALREHFNNPEIASKLMKLIDAGLISFR